MFAIFKGHYKRRTRYAQRGHCSVFFFFIRIQSARSRREEIATQKNVEPNTHTHNSSEKKKHKELRPSVGKCGKQ